MIELGCALNDLSSRGLERLVDGPEEPSRNHVLGVEDAHDLAAALGEGDVQRLRLVLLVVAVDDDAEARVVTGRIDGDPVRFRVVVTDDDEDLERGMVETGQLGHGCAENLLLVPRRHDQREREGGLERGACELRLGEGVGVAPGVEHERDRRCANERQEPEHDHQERLADPERVLVRIQAEEENQRQPGNAGREGACPLECGLEVARRDRRHAELEHESGRLTGDPEGHLRFAHRSIAENDRNLRDAKAGKRRAVRQLDLKAVAARLRLLMLDPLEDLAAEALEPAGQIANRQAEQQARVQRSCPADQTAAQRPRLDDAPVDVARPEHDVGSPGGGDQGAEVGRVVREVAVHLRDQVVAASERPRESRPIRASQALLPAAVDDLHPSVLRGQLVRHPARAVGRSVVEDEDRAVQTARVEHAQKRRDEGADVLDLVVCRDADAQPRRLGRRCGRVRSRERPGTRKRPASAERPPLVRQEADRRDEDHRHAPGRGGFP